MTIKVNGEEQNIDQDSISVSELLIRNNVKQPEMVSVQLNGAFVEKDLFSTTKLNSNDEIDFLYFMGGGQ